MEHIKLKSSYNHQKKEKRHLRSIRFTSLKNNRHINVECYLLNKESIVSGSSKFLQMEYQDEKLHSTILFPEHLTVKLEEIVGNYHAIDFLNNTVHEYGYILNLCVSENNQFKRMSLHATKYGEELILELKDKRNCLEQKYIPLALDKQEAGLFYELLMNFNHHKYKVWI